MDVMEIRGQFLQAVKAGEVEEVRRLLDRHPDAVAPLLHSYLHDAASHNQVEVMALLVGRGASVDAHYTELDPMGPVHGAAGEGAADAVRWLFERGAAVAYEDGGRVRSPGLAFAAMGGHLEIVRMFVEAGAPLDSHGEVALEAARRFGHGHVVEYLRSLGVPDDGDDDDEGDDGDAIEVESADDESVGEEARIGGPLPELRQHLQNTMLGMIADDAFVEILPSYPSISVLVLDQFGIRKALVTEGMSRLPLNTDPDFRWAELVIRLPADWPVDESIREDRHYWPLGWIRRLAHLPHQQGMGYRLFTLYDHEEPLGEGCRFTGFLIIAGPGDAGSYTRSDGEKVVLYDLLPLYPEELELADREGIRALLTRLDGRDDVREVTVDRPSLVPPA